ncbi:OmpA family protein [Parapedobacter pyrenivorans]|uniref:OmpA family protein n=1 Tax=Parapedobacter pyrenivorans TaxID=1305674 RepID=UPI00333F75DD
MKYHTQPLVLFLSSTLMLFAGVVRAQEQPTLRDRAEELYRRYEYAHATQLYLKLVDTRKPRLEDLERLSDSYWKMNDYESAVKWYAKLIAHEDHTPEQLLRYGEALKANGKYTEAKRQLEAYALSTGDGAAVALQLAGCDSALRWMANPTMHRLRNEREVNTPRSEFSVFSSGKHVFYAGEPSEATTSDTYGWTGNPFLQVFAAPMTSTGELGSGTIFDELNSETRFHIGPVTASADGGTLYVTQTHAHKAGEFVRESVRRYRTQLLELYCYQRKGDRWIGEPFAYNNVSAYSLGHAALSPDGNTLYFISDMPGGQGGTDIWYSERQLNGSWGSPINAGAVINSAGDELFPNVAADGIMYFASDGFAGMGGLDVFQAMGSKGKWSNPVNLGYPVNSATDDFAYLVHSEYPDGLRGFLSSNRPGGVGRDDIYSFSYTEPKIFLILQGTTSDKTSGEPLSNVTVTLVDGDRQVIGRKDSEAGAFAFELDPGRTYNVSGQKQGYSADSAAVSTLGITASDTLRIALLLEPAYRVGQTFELKNIYYDFDKHDIRADAARVLDELVRILDDNQTLKIELSSHTDSRGSRLYNEALSKRRAKAAVDYLASRGIAPDRLVARGYGETRPVNDCSDSVPCSREAHQANRRTEITVLAY